MIIIPFLFVPFTFNTLYQHWHTLSLKHSNNVSNKKKYSFTNITHETSHFLAFLSILLKLPCFSHCNIFTLRCSAIDAIRLFIEIFCLKLWQCYHWSCLLLQQFSSYFFLPVGIMVVFTFYFLLLWEEIYRLPEDINIFFMYTFPSHLTISNTF